MKMNDIEAENDDNRFDVFELSLAVISLVNYVNKECKLKGCFKDLDVLSNKVQDQCRKEKDRVDVMREKIRKLKNKNKMLRNLLELSKKESSCILNEMEKVKKTFQNQACYSHIQPISNVELKQAEEIMCQQRHHIKTEAKRLKDFEKESNDIIFSLERKIKNLEKDLIRRGRTILQLTEKLNGKRSEENNFEIKTHEFDNEISKLKGVLQHTLTKLSDTEVELEETKTRLSKVMGSRLTDNNPNIADLSDSNRPTKLAERFTELYDNQWTDAFERINKYFHTETETIHVLLYIVKDVLTFCQLKEKEQIQNLQCALQMINKQVHKICPAEPPKYLKDCRKTLSSFALRQLYERYISHIRNSNDRILQKALEIDWFTKDCIELIWLMVIQDPPIVFAVDAERGSKFDTNLYKPYTSSGTFIDYIVWPPLLLYKNGPILVKGVAQAYGRKSKFNSEKSDGGNLFRLCKESKASDPRSVNVDMNKQKYESTKFHVTGTDGLSNRSHLYRKKKYSCLGNIPIGFDLVNSDLG